jgi:hypothetical protein
MKGFTEAQIVAFLRAADVGVPSWFDTRLRPADTPSTVERGLCATCTHAETVTSSKGSEFVLCRLSFRDPSFVRYPRLPVVACSGYARKPGTSPLTN